MGSNPIGHAANFLDRNKRLTGATAGTVIRIQDHDLHFSATDRPTLHDEIAATQIEMLDKCGQTTSLSSLPVAA